MKRGIRGRVITLVFFMRRHGLCMLALDGTFAQAEMPVYPRILHFFVTKCVHVYPDGRLVSGSKMGPCRRIFNASVLTRPPTQGRGGRVVSADCAEGARAS